MTSITENGKLSYLKSSRDKWILILTIGLFSFGFLLFFQPFGVNNYDPENTITLPLILATFSVALVNMLTLMFTEFYLRRLIVKKWTLKIMALWFIFVAIIVSSITFIFYNFLGDWHDLRFSSYLEFLVDIPVMGAIPFSGLLLYFNLRDTRNRLSIEERKNPKSMIKLVSDNHKEFFTITLDQLLYIESQENYVAVHYLENSLVKKKLLRARMKSMESQLENTPLIRCHRSYIVNLNMVVKFHERSGSSVVFLEHSTQEFPISETYKNAIELFKAI